MSLKYRSFLLRLCGILFGLSTTVSAPGVAQATTPDSGGVASGVQDATLPSPYTPTAGDRARALALMDMTGVRPLEPDGQGGWQYVPPDSVEPVKLARAAAWYRALSTPGNTGTGLETMELASLAGRISDFDADRRYIDARLAAPGLSLTDRGELLQSVASAFMNPKYPEHHRWGLHYLRQLDALSGDAMINRFNAHVAIGEMDYNAEQDSAALAEFAKALHLVPQLRVEVRYLTLNVVAEWALLVSGRPQGRAQIDSVLTAFKALLRPSEQEVVEDTSSWHRSAEFWQHEWTDCETLLKHLGEPAPPVIATHWLNASPFPLASPEAPGARRLDVADGKVRVLILGKTMCDACDVARHIVDSTLQATYPQVEFWYMTFTGGAWGLTNVTPDEEVAHIKRYYLDFKHETMPIAIWAGPIQPTPDGGAAPMQSPTYEQLVVPAYPTIVVVDGNGIVRTFGVGPGFLRDPHTQTLLHHLVAASPTGSQHAMGTTPGAELSAHE